MMLVNFYDAFARARWHDTQSLFHCKSLRHVTRPNILLLQNVCYFTSATKSKHTSLSELIRELAEIVIEIVSGPC